MRKWLTALSFGLTIAAAVFLLVWPVYSGTAGDRPIHATLLQVNGPWVILALMLPVAIALLPLVSHRHVLRVFAAIAVGGFAFLAGFSIGLFYIPAAIFMLLASIVPSPKIRQAHP